ncbi:DNA alkylation repair protein [Paenibacillus sp. YYML68]|uniref:DNA alkylation repair protein n=1 Tax=Paenibacillus sp. YYML68 TaxID=2909250 RepID=UPI002490418E|nr:DNA alkylation repair protein [Paenibacillus sp. YYML68]
MMSEQQSSKPSTSTSKALASQPAPYVSQLEALLREQRDAANAVKMEAYMKNQFPFLGVRTPERNALLRAFFKEYGIPEGPALTVTVKQLWSLPEREFQYVAMIMLDKRLKSLSATDLPLLEELIVTKGWWDTVDLLASHQVGAVLARHLELREEMTSKWIQSDSMWLQRTAILFQLGYKARTDTALLFSLCRQLGSDERFFIRKAIGWALREYGKTDEAAVRQFVAEAGTGLAPLSVREALKYMDRSRK